MPPRMMSPPRLSRLAWRAVMVVVLGGLLCRSTLGHRNTIREDPSALPNLDIDLDSFYYERALTPSETTLLASTLDGTLVAINQLSGEVLWELREEPVVKSPPAFLPDPKDGSIYMIGGGLKDPLKKLPFTIPELVAASPCKSSDGILYIGKKVDTWFSVDRYTGDRQGSISFGGCVAGTEGQCPNLKPANILIGRTEYNIMMYDSRAEGRRWNISFFDYSSNLSGADVDPDYELAHFTDSSSGSLVTLDRKSGMIQWERHIGSPVVAMYRMEGDGIVNVPFTSVSKETLANLMDQFNAPETNNEVIGETKLFPTLYVGEHEHGLYAMPSLVDEQTLTISPTSPGPLMLEGPQNFQIPPEINIEVIGGNDDSSDDPLGIPMYSDTTKDKSSVLLFGYYQVPDHSSIKLSPATGPLQLTTQISSMPRGLAGVGQSSDMRYVPPIFPAPNGDPASKGPIPTYNAPYYLYQFTPRTPSGQVLVAKYNVAVIEDGLRQLKELNFTFVVSGDFVRFSLELVPLCKDYLMGLENKELKAIVLLLIVTLVVLIKLPRNTFKLSATLSSSGIRMSNSSAGSTSSVSGYEFTAHPIELENGVIKVGNITFDPKEILGKGCEGTFVYRGRFDNRDVAVKRVLAACFSIADREVDLLRESDEHPNVIRYFCMEQDRQFRYIALEYCSATLQDYIEEKYKNPNLDPLSILRQATQGLMHLHSLDIVHRDIKPHNVLISMPGKKGEVRAMISDFGLCKKLKVGRMSFSRRSGVAGTEGWIAPEMMLGNRSNTCAVDIFSLGCVYHFVLSKGHHPFGESFRRQANILSGEYVLNSLVNETARTLIEKMMSFEQNLRPSTQAVLRHPLFWGKEKTLSFLQDVSDRVDKEDNDSAIVLALERCKPDIFSSNWPDVLDGKVREDLRKHRTYDGKKVRDLLRALRNKKHHYNELPEEIKFMYGRIPDQFVDYWTRRFPKLLIRSWQSMHCIKSEPTFMKYFDRNYDFLQDVVQTTIMDSLIAENSQENVKPGAVEACPDRTEMSLVPEESETRHGDPDSLFGLRYQRRNNSNGDANNDESQSSVISHWDNIDSERLKDHFPLESSDQFAQIESDPLHKNMDPFPLKDNGFPFSAAAADVVAAVGTKESPKVRRRIAQLASEAMQNYLTEAEERKAAFRPTWAEALRNITADDKVAEAATAAAMASATTAPATATVAEKRSDNKENCDPVELCFEESSKEEEDVATTEGVAVVVVDQSSCTESRAEDVINDDDRNVADDDDVMLVELNVESGPVWVLPPVVENPKKKKGKKKKVKAKE